jgi:hypothetical protein
MPEEHLRAHTGAESAHDPVSANTLHIESVPTETRFRPRSLVFCGGIHAWALWGGGVCPGSREAVS